MSLHALPRLITDLLVTGLGVMAIADGVAHTGLLHPAAVVFTIGWVLALLARRRWPWSPALVPLVLVVHAVALQSWPNESLATMLALFVSAGLFGLEAPVVRALATAPLWPASIGALMLVTSYGEEGLSDVFYPGVVTIVLLGGGTVVGQATRSRRAARGSAEAADRQLAQRRAAIAAEERSRIAQDLRALIAEQIRDIHQRAVSTRSLLERGQTTAAEQILLQIEDAGRETLADLRHMLGLLRRDMTEEALDPQPGIGALDAVVERAQRAGVAVTVVVEGRPAPMPRGVEVVVYRVVERTVEQACRAAGVDRVGVRIRHDPDAVAVNVHAHGLASLVRADHLAIRERVVLYGGDLLIGTDEHDRDVLQVRIPLPAPAQAAPT